MHRFMTHDLPADDAYPFESDLHQMADDGCPLAPDPVGWADGDWRDNLGAFDTFEIAVPTSARAASRPEAVAATARRQDQFPQDFDLWLTTGPECN
jgi:hypothetical protein